MAKQLDLVESFSKLTTQRSSLPGTPPILAFRAWRTVRWPSTAQLSRMTVFAHFPLDTHYFGDGSQQSMVNFRVDDLDACWPSSPRPAYASTPNATTTPLAVLPGSGTLKATDRALATPG